MKALITIAENCEGEWLNISHITCLSLFLPSFLSTVCPMPQAIRQVITYQKHQWTCTHCVRACILIVRTQVSFDLTVNYILNLIECLNTFLYYHFYITPLLRREGEEQRVDEHAPSPTVYITMSAHRENTISFCKERPNDIK